MEEALRSVLLATSGLSLLVSDRIAWGLRPITLPAVRLTVVSKVPIQTYGGPSSLVPYRVQADAFGRTYAEAKKVARALGAGFSR